MWLEIAGFEGLSLIGSRCLVRFWILCFSTGLVPVGFWVDFVLHLRGYCCLVLRLEISVSMKKGVCKEGGGKGNVMEQDAELVEEKKDLLAMNDSDSNDNRLGDDSLNGSKNIEDDVKDVNKENKGVEAVNGDMLSNDNCGKEIKKEMKGEDEEERRQVMGQGGREKLEWQSGCQTTGEREIIEEVVQSEKRKASEVYTPRRVLRSDARREKEALTHEKEHVQSQSEKRRTGEPSDAEVPLKRIKSVSPKFQEGKAEEVDRKTKMEINDNVKGEIKMESHRDSRVLNHDRKRSSKLSEDQIESNSNKTSNMQAGSLKRKKRSCHHNCGMLKDENSLDADGNDDADVLEQTSHVRKAQSSVSHAKRRDKEKSVMSQSPASPRIATRNALKYSPLSEGKSFHNIFGLKDISGRDQAMGKSSLSNKVKSRLKANVNLSPRKGLKKIDVSDIETDCEGRNHISSNPNASVMMKHRTNEKSGAISTAKHELREKIKGILLGAGWKIDLRPRRGRMYLDSVYIPPEGKGSYWSITKAYAVYQAKLENIYTGKSKTSEASCKRSEDNDCNFDAGSSSSIIPMESLNMLKRITVKKRAKKELGDAKKGKRKKKKDFSKEIHPKKTKVGKIRRMKRTYATLGSNTINASASKVRQHLQTRRSKQKGCALLARGANQEAELDNNNHVLYSGKRTMLSWMIDLGIVSENGKVKYMNNRGTKSKLEGWIKNDGIYCSCCSEILTIGDFENHAGSKLKQASQNIFVEELGISLLQCQINAWEKQSESERKGFYAINISDDDPNDDTCGICGDGGDLICCDGCPSTFHLSCLGIQMLPSGDWNCTNCSCKFCGTVSASRESAESLTSPPLLSCSQCEEKYHQACVPESDSFSVGSSSSGLSFCGQSCRKAFRKLQKLLGAKNAMEDGFTWSLIRRFDDDNSRSPVRLSQRVECNSKIALAFAVMNECFLPIYDRRSDINLIHNVVYNCGSNFDRLNYEGFYVFILERGDEMISAASVRIHGTRLAEMPFIGTRHMYRRQGMCRRLLGGIETALCSLNVEKLVIPAISEMKNTWTTVFGFKPLEPSQELEIRSIKFLVFPGTGLLQKPLLKKCPIEPFVATNGVAPDECNMEHHNEAAHESYAAEDDTHILMLGQTKKDSGCVALPSATKKCHLAPQESLGSSKDLPAHAESIISSNSSDTTNNCLQVANDLDQCEELPSGLNEIPTQQISPRGHKSKDSVSDLCILSCGSKSFVTPGDFQSSDVTNSLLLDSGTTNFRHDLSAPKEAGCEIAIDTSILGDEGSVESIPPCSVNGAANCGSELVKEIDKGSDYTSETANVSIL